MKTDKIFELINANKNIGEVDTMLTILAMMQIGELERLAKIGKATELAFENGATVEGCNVECYTLEQLIEWSGL